MHRVWLPSLLPKRNNSRDRIPSQRRLPLFRLAKRCCGPNSNLTEHCSSESNRPFRYLSHRLTQPFPFCCPSCTCRTLVSRMKRYASFWTVYAIRAILISSSLLFSQTKPAIEGDPIDRNQTETLITRLARSCCMHVIDTITLML